MNVGTAQGLIGQMTRQLESSARESKWAESVFEELFLNYYSRIVAVLSRLVGDRAQAEELAIEVFWKAYRQPVLGKLDGNPSGWLYRTATNLGIDALRAAARRKQYEHAAGRAALESGASAGPLEEVLRAEKSHRVRAVLALLKPAQAQILILRSSGLSYVELAESLGVKRGSVGTMLTRAERVFQRRYLKMYGHEEES